MVDLYCLEELVDFMGRLTIEKEGLMDFGRRITLYVLLYIALCSAAFAQVVEIPDPNLGLEHATSLTSLLLHNNDISDLRALSPLVNLTFIRLHGNQINDLSPLANLIELTTLPLDSNNITDISPLANLTQLTTLVLGENNRDLVVNCFLVDLLAFLFLMYNNFRQCSES